MKAISSFLLLAIFCPLLSGTSDAFAQNPPFWDNLKSGPHKVGFRSVWKVDYSRSYNVKFKDGTKYSSQKGPRPILINIWYPAKQQRTEKLMQYGEYLSIESNNPDLKTISKELSLYNRDLAKVDKSC